MHNFVTEPSSSAQPEVGCHSQQPGARPSVRQEEPSGQLHVRGVQRRGRWREQHSAAQSHV